MKIGLALSGGGVKGAAHLGVIKYIEELGLDIDCISGTSAGSIVAALYASGYTIDEMIENVNAIIESKDIFDYDFIGILSYIISLIFRREGKIEGIIKGKRIKKTLYDILALKGVYKISDVKIPLAIPAVNINNSKTDMFMSNNYSHEKNNRIEYINDALLSEVVRASCSVPVVFKPEIIEGKRMVDGGLETLVPVNVLKDMGADRVIAVNVGYSGYEREYIDNIFEIAGQAINIMGYRVAAHDLANADSIINVTLNDVGLLQTEKILDCIRIGYNTAKKSKEQIIKGLLKK